MKSELQKAVESFYPRTLTFIERCARLLDADEPRPEGGYFDPNGSGNFTLCDGVRIAFDSETKMWTINFPYSKGGMTIPDSDSARIAPALRSFREQQSAAVDLFYKAAYGERAGGAN